MKKCEEICWKCAEDTLDSRNLMVNGKRNTICLFQVFKGEAYDPDLVPRECTRYMEHLILSQEMPEESKGG